MALDQEWIIKHDDFTNKNREWTREARDLTAQSDQFMAWEPILSNPQIHRKVGHLEISVEQSIVFWTSQKRNMFSCFGRSQKTLAMNYEIDILSPMLANHRCWQFAQQHVPKIPKSPSQKFCSYINIPAPCFANTMGVPPGFWYPQAGIPNKITQSSWMTMTDRLVSQPNGDDGDPLWLSMTDRTPRLFNQNISKYIYLFWGGA